MIPVLMPPLLALALVVSMFSALDRIVPVVAFMQSVPVAAEGDVMVKRVYGYRLRQCRGVNGTLVGWYKRDGVWFDTPIWREAADTNSSHKDLGWGRRYFGEFTWEQVPQEATHVRLSITHDCDGRLRTTILAEWAR